MKHWIAYSLGLAVAIAPAYANADFHMDEQQRALHAMNRLGYGPSSKDLDHIQQVGVERYIDEQLHPESISLPSALEQQLAAAEARQPSTEELLIQYKELQKSAKQTPVEKPEKHQFVQQLLEDTATARLMRAINSPRQLQEVMVDFWFNHFNVYEAKGLDRIFIAQYEREAIRPYALGHFRDLLGATAKSPAMLFYLDNWLSTAPGFKPLGLGPQKQKANGLNENYARELMELHTLGVDGGYTQKDVTELARVFTGWTIDPRSGAFRYVDRRHDQGEKEWLELHINPGGQSEGERALDVLANSPATAKHISYQLAQYFVADQPPPALVDKLAQTFIHSGGDIRQVLNTLFHSTEFWDAANYSRKFKTPYQYAISSIRAANVQVVNYRPILNFLRQSGMPLYGCPTPDGYKNTEEAWLNPEALSRRITFATALAAGKLPLEIAPDSDMSSAMGDGNMSGNQTPRQMSMAVDSTQLAQTLQGALSEDTQAKIAAAAPRLQSALMLGGPDFMRH